MAQKREILGVNIRNPVKKAKDFIPDGLFLNQIDAKETTKYVWDAEKGKFWLAIYQGNDHPLLESKSVELNYSIKPRLDAAQLRIVRKMVQMGTLQAIVAGKYQIASGEFCIIPKNNIIKSIQNRKIYSTGHKFPEFPQTVEAERNDKFSAAIGNTRCLVVNADCLDTTLLIKQGYPVVEGETTKWLGRSVAAVVAASPYQCGGGWKKGNSGQEENICRRTGLIHAYEDPFGLARGQQADNKPAASEKTQEYKQKGKKRNKNRKLEEEIQKTNGEWKIDEFGGIFCPKVPYFRGSEAEGYPFLHKPEYISFISVAGKQNRTLSK